MSKTRKISLTRALAEVKLIESKLEKVFLGFDVEVNGKLVYNSHLSADDFTKDATSKLDSFTSLEENRFKLKSLIAKANIETKTNLCGKDYSIIELIDLKASSRFKFKLLSNLKTNHTQCKNAVEIQEQKIQQEVSKQVEMANSNKTQVKDSLAETLTNSYKTLYEGKIIGLDYNNIEKMTQELEALLADIDMTLSEINAKTEIEVDF